MKTLAKSFAPSFALFALFAAGLPLTASSGNKTATSAMQVSFVVKEACTVQTATGPARVQQRGATTVTAPAPVVACELKTPYLLTRGADQPAAATTNIDRAAAPIRTESGAQNWVVYF